MANMMDYLKWRGDLTFTASPWNDVDSLIAAALCYNRLNDPAAATPEGETLAALAPRLDLRERDGDLWFRQWRDLLYAAADTVRFGGMRLHDYVDTVDAEIGMQFSAVTMEPGDGRCVIAYRGTDSTLVGWKEDVELGCTSPVPSQTAAVAYLERIAAASDRGLCLVGHSKGGNLAAYAALHASGEVSARIESVYSFDGPGLTESDTGSEAYERLRPRLHSVIPQMSVVGLLLGYHRDYTVVRSDKKGFLQHDSFSWQLDGPAFSQVPEIERPSAILCEGMHRWLGSLDDEQRRGFVECIYTLLDATCAETTQELTGNLPQSIAAMLSALRRMDPETHRFFTDLLRRLAEETTGSVGKYFDEKLETLRAGLPFLRSGQEAREDRPTDN